MNVRFLPFFTLYILHTRINPRKIIIKWGSVSLSFSVQRYFHLWCVTLGWDNSCRLELFSLLLLEILCWKSWWPLKVSSSQEFYQLIILLLSSLPNFNLPILLSTSLSFYLCIFVYTALYQFTYPSIIYIFFKYLIFFYPCSNVIHFNLSLYKLRYLSLYLFI